MPRKPKAGDDKQIPGNDKPNGKSVKWPAERVKRMSVDRLLPYARNARLHTDTQVDQLAAAIGKFGFTNPIIVDKAHEIIAGHGRVMAAKKLGLSEVPVVVIQEGEWSSEDVAAYRIWDNQSALLSTWDDELLRVDVQALNTEGYDLQLLGFPAATLGVILDGWSSDVDVKDRFGSNLDGIRAKVIALVEPDQVERATTVVKKALSDAGISHEIA